MLEYSVFKHVSVSNIGVINLLHIAIHHLLGLPPELFDFKLD